MRRGFLFGALAAFVFAAAAAVMVGVMPGPLKDTDYVVIGSVATLLSLLVLFVALVSFSGSARDVFFKRRRKQR